MPPIRPTIPTGLDGLSWIITDDGSKTLWNELLGETYHSGCGAVAEALVVYLDHSGVLEQLCRSQPMRILEIGFGTGTNFLITAALAMRFGAPLAYWSVEHRVLPGQLIAQLELDRHLPAVILDNQRRQRMSDQVCVSDFAAIPSLTQRLASYLDSVAPAKPSNSCQLSESVELSLIVGDAGQVVNGKLAGELAGLDAIYFDAFSPDACPELWSAELLRSMYELLRPGGTLTSYCVKSSVRQRLQHVGFDVQRRLGPASGKREVLLAIRQPRNDQPA
ncbi:MAG: tRNA (5-methylaminomethyl-2-thiouridine)(34)-methyltransferase MnmD [Pirellulaceae bacterium]|nr:tRNA (5-methylaminomethyl-2-thiouridine)(34)-methyltransferase MnmD [Pirellulaceae bacterium]